MAEPAQNETEPAGGSRGLKMENLQNTLATFGNTKDYSASNIEALTATLEGVSAPEIIAVVGSATAIERGASLALAIKFNTAMPFRWDKCQYREISDNNKIWEPVRRKTTEALKAAGHPNPAQFIARVREQNAKIHGEDVSKPDGGKNRTPYVRFTEELGKLYVFGNRPENDEAIANDPYCGKVKVALLTITKCLRDDLGVDLNRFVKE